MFLLVFSMIYSTDKKNYFKSQISKVDRVGRRSFRGHDVNRQRRQNKKHLIEAALFGRLDQMLSTIV